MKLLCFVGLSAGGLVCDLLNGTRTVITNEGVSNREHSVLKGVTPYLDKGKFNEILWGYKLKNYRSLYQTSEDVCLGTHTHPSCIPQKYLDIFSEIFVITCLTKESKIYLYLRYKHLYPNLPINPGAVCLDFPPINNCIAIEFSDIVNGKFVEEYNLDVEHFERWKAFNSFLYKELTQDEQFEFENLMKRYKQETLYEYPTRTSTI